MTTITFFSVIIIMILLMTLGMMYAVYRSGDERRERIKKQLHIIAVK